MPTANNGRRMHVAGIPARALPGAAMPPTSRNHWAENDQKNERKDAEARPTSNRDKKGRLMP